MFSKILVANRGEIACRVMKTARRLGIETVAVYSDADRDGVHVEMADEAVHLGPAPASESYLVGARIIEACLQTGAEAVHPGYGFLSENAAFANACAEAGIAFIGPPAGAIEAMGDKITSKNIAREAGVATVPGDAGLSDDVEQAATSAGAIGYPVMIKASAGGGGKGMRVAWNEQELREGFDRARSEAVSSFGDGRIFIEKFVTDPRHIEIQVLADQHGNAIYLGERECSIQRRNQKVVEEAPSPFLDETTRAAMGEQAVALARAVGYASAGTVEFIVDSERNFYFLEMNTRLQVEHPVTEEITGLDLVEEMLRVAAGEPLRLAQQDVRLNGWAVETRVYAEDPFRNFLPSPGRLVRYRPPAEIREETRVVRNDTGVAEGGEVSPYYDPMISKLVTWAPDRAAAIAAMADALDRFELEGIGHNLPFLQAVMGQERFQEGRLTTGYIAEEFADGFTGADLSPERRNLLRFVAATLRSIDARRRRDSEEIDEWSVFDDHQRHDVTLTTDENGRWRAKGDDGTINGLAINWRPGDTLVRIGSPEGGELVAKVSPITAGLRLRHRGAELDLTVLPRHAADLMAHMPVREPPDHSRYLMCPMPGQIVRIDVAEGDRVEIGQALVVVEAMKMENILRAEKTAIVASINYEVGAVLAVDDIIIEYGEAAS